ncbi:hypothetical protein EAO74_34680 [Streptomyces sp. gb1(2016)]|uniref:Uncharacterized protein n=1 Tax=Streptomyces sp. gb1(2016) TaxID=1828321 RepID=A0A652KPC4_9ACTN|nr:hypothetical protein EAO74_34680 [Streptomyces sp. gb1(2016)]
MKDVGGHDSPRGAVNQALIRGFPNGETRQSSWAVRCREAERISKSRSQFGLGSATRPHEVGVASNRRSALLR